MNNTLASKVLSIISVILLGVGAVSAISVFVTGNETYIDFLLYWTIGLAVFAFAAILVLSLINIVGSKKSLINLAIVAVIAVALIFGAHSMSSDVLPTFHGIESYNLTIATAKWVDTALYVTYILFGSALLGLGITAIRSAAE